MADDLTVQYDHIEGVHIHHPSNDLEDAGVLTAKTTALCVLFVASIVMGLLPIKISKVCQWTQSSDVKSNPIVSLLLSFGGGVLLCTTFQHLLPEVNEGIAELQEHHILPELDIHLGEFLMCVGFFIIFLIEELVHLYLHRREKRMNSELEHVFRRSLSIRRGDKLETNIAATISTADLIKNGTLPKCEVNSDLEAHVGHSHFPSFSSSEDSFVVSLRGLLVVLALSIHELFEGLAVGLEKSTSNVWYMLGAVAAHKLVIAFCVGVELVANKTRLALTIVYVFIFAIVSPLGIGLGILLNLRENTEDDNITEVMSVLLQGLATGTLLYVVFFEVLQRDRQGLKQYFAILVGFFLMFAMHFVSE